MTTKSHVTDDIKAVFFDFDDTLVGTRLPIWDMHRHIAKTYYDIDLSDEKLLEHWGQPIDVLAQHYYQTDDIRKGTNYIMLENANFPKTQFKYTVPILKKLRQAGKKIGIVTASHLDILKLDFINTDFDGKLVDYIQTADDTVVHKPNPAVFDPMIAWSKAHGIKPREILYIGDGLHDMLAAKGAGLHFIGVTTGLTTAADFEANGIESIADLSLLRFPNK
jgi:HAD superfamily hydrolase (TIGR01549 family)